MERAKGLKSHAALLKFIGEADLATQRRVLNLADKKLISVLCEICFNTLRGVVHLKEKEKKLLRKHKTHLRRVSQRGENWRKKKKRLLQSGKGFLSAVLSPIIATLLSAFLSKK